MEKKRQCGGGIRGFGSLGRPALRLASVLAVVLLFGGCRIFISSSDDHYPVVSVTHILSDVDADGDIAFTPPDTYVLTSARTTGTVLAGIDPVHGDEFRGFLDFPLRESRGLPYHAVIESATLEIFISSVAERNPGAGVPLLVDLVSFQPPTLVAGDFDRVIQPALLSQGLDIVAADTGTVVALDVTALVIEAQRRGLPDFQIRLLLDIFASSGLVEIEDNLPDTAPQLTVTYR